MAVTGGVAARVLLRAESGEVIDLGAERWLASASADDRSVLATVRGPVLDLGCGPGRIVVSLARRGVLALGVDASPSAVALARLRGAPVLERDLFGPLPGEGRWRTVLLFDGNIGIGGDPVRLLARCRQLLRPDGRALVEVGEPGIDFRRVTARFEVDGRCHAGFPWAMVGADAIDGLAAEAGLAPAGTVVTPSGRWFAHLQRVAPWRRS